MSDKITYVLRPYPHPSRELAKEQIDISPDGWHITMQPPTRSLEQNSLLWALLTNISSQVVWHGRKLDTESWKHIFSSSLKKMDVVPNLEGNGFVVLGLSTSKMTKREMNDLIDLITAFAVEHEVNINETV